MPRKRGDRLARTRTHARRREAATSGWSRLTENQPHRTPPPSPGVVELRRLVEFERDRAERAKWRAAFLGEATTVLTSSLDWEEMLQLVSRLAVPALADAWTVDVLEDDGALRRCAEAAVDPDRLDSIRSLRRFAPGPSRRSSVWRALTSGRSVHVPAYTDLYLRQIAPQEAADEYLDLMRRIGPRSSVTVPMVARGRIVGAMVFVMAESGRRYEPSDISLAEELARHVALAVDNSRLYAAEKLARAEAEARGASLALLAAAGEALSVSLDVTETLRAISRLAVPRLADCCVAEIVGEPDPPRVAVTHIDSRRERLIAALRRRYPPDATSHHPVSHVLRSGAPVVLGSLPHADRAGDALDPHLRLLARLGFTSGIIVPMTARGRTLGAITLANVGPTRSLTAADLPLARELARRAGVAIDNARLYAAASESRDQLRVVLDNVADGILAFDRSRTIRMWNAAAEQILGYRADEAVGGPLQRIMPLFSAQADASASTRAGAGFVWPDAATTPGHPFWARHEDGSLVPIEFDVRPVELRGESMYTMVIRDVSQRLELDRAKNEFISVVSHELRTPLTAIRGSLGLLGANVVGTLPSTAADLVRVAASNTERLIRLVNDILDLEKSDAGRLTLDAAAFDARAAAEEVLAALRPMADAARVALTSGGDPRATIRADRDRVTQVLTNLVSNAIKFSPARGTVAVTVTNDSRELRFAVRDEGDGIPREQQNLLFVRFQQLDPASTRRTGGTGLGLAISKSLVERMGGTIGVDSAPGRGSVFWFTLPADGAAEAAP